MTANSVEMIEAFSNAGGVSGFEDEVLAVAREFADPSFEIEEDKLRNLYLRRKAPAGDGPVVMIDGHSDEVGFMIQHIEKNGTLKFIPMGGWQAQVVMGQKVKIKNNAGQYVTGIVAAKPPHFMKPEEKKKLVEIPEMMIDVGAGSAEEVGELFGIEPGAPVVPDVRFAFNDKSGLMTGKAFDCRLGCAAVLDTLNTLAAESPGVTLVGTLSSQEEVGLRGVRVSARKVNPDVAIIFEGTPADDVFKEEITAQAALKKGPQIRHRDNTMIANPRFVQFARGIAKEMNLAFQDAVRDSGGTNGGMVHLSGRGIPTLVLGVPVRYIHSPHGYAALADYEAMVALACEIIRRLERGVIDGF